MTKVAFQAWLQDGGEFAGLGMEVDGKPAARMVVDASELDAIIARLAKLRSQLHEEVTPQLEAGDRVEAVLGPSWRIAPAPNPDTRFLVLRHPGHGWLGYLFPAPIAEEIGQWLTHDLSGRSIQ
jgi:hypothetical protein